jgi:hypothetical protein
MAIAQQTKDSIVQILLKTGKISQSGLNECCRVAEKSKRPVEEILVEMGFITQDEMTEARGRQIGVAFLRIADIPVDPDIIEDTRRDSQKVLRFSSGHAEQHPGGSYGRSYGYQRFR